MNILSIHKHYFRRDGASTYFLDVNDLVEQHGHQVVPFSMHHQQNIETPYQKYFASEVDFATRSGLVAPLKKAVRFLHNTEAVKKLDLLIADHGPFDVAHIHNIYHHLSPSILPVLKKHGIPVVMTVHDYKLVSSDYTLVKKQSVTEKALGGLERMLHTVLGSYNKNVDLFLAPSKFMKQFCVKAGWPEERFVHLPYLLDVDSFGYQKEDKGYVVYAGRLSHEKGVETVLQAAAQMPDVIVKIAGVGPERKRLQHLARQKAINNVEFLGFLEKDAVQELIGSARVAVVPSEWLENYPFAVLEAMSMGTIVVASKIGGIPEQIIHGKTGFLFTPHDVGSLVVTLQQVMALSSAQRHAIGLAAREFVVSHHNPAHHYAQLLKIYEQVAS